MPPPTPALAVLSGDNRGLLRLGRLKRGETAVVRRITGRAEDVHRLEEFGLCHGTTVEMFRPGNPCILRLAGGKVCLRASHALEILVAPA